MKLFTAAAIAFNGNCGEFKLGNILRRALCEEDARVLIEHAWKRDWPVENGWHGHMIMVMEVKPDLVTKTVVITR